jgi:purine-nucleoside phosphorylase
MNELAVINPLPGKKRGTLGYHALMAATQPDVKNLASNLGFQAGEGRFFLNSQVYTRKDGDDGFSLVGPFIGAPHAVLLLENLICQGISQVIFTGWCGSVSPNASVGDIIIPSKAYSDEGTSGHYPLSEGMPSGPDTALADLLADACQGQGLPVKRGAVWTTDAIYRETPEKIDHFRKMGALAVDMEFSALLTVAAFRGIQLAAALIVSDEVWSHTWKTGFKNPAFKTNRNTLTQTLAAVVKRMTHG